MGRTGPAAGSIVISMACLTVALALALDALVGDPDRLWRRIGHPVRWFGTTIEVFDALLNRGSSRALSITTGALAIVLASAIFAIPAALIGHYAQRADGGFLLAAVLASTLIAHNSLNRHVMAVANADSLPDGRRALSLIVGRDVSQLDENGVAGAALESLGESLSDGVVAPAFWLAVGGLPGLVIYKVVNTADSMIGHRTPRHEAFGKAAARVDDVMNLVPARLSAVLILLAAPRRLPAIVPVRREARQHASPNAGWPEAALAYVLSVRIGGPRRYEDRVVDGVRLNPSGRPPGQDDIRRAVAICNRAGFIQLLAYCGLALAFW